MLSIAPITLVAIAERQDEITQRRGSAKCKQLKMGEGPNDSGLTRKHIMAQVEASLKRLGTDYIDLCQIHSFDPLTLPPEYPGWMLSWTGRDRQV